jgi:hypothetical protein
MISLVPVELMEVKKWFGKLNINGCNSLRVLPKSGAVDRKYDPPSHNATRAKPGG